MLDSFNLLSVFSFLYGPKLSFDTNDGHEGEALVYYISHDALPAAALKACFEANSKSRKREKEDTVTSYCEAFS